MAYAGYLMKIGNYTIPTSIIRADSYYAYDNMQDYEPWTDAKGYGAWISPLIFQYTSTGRVEGYSGNLDLDIAYISKSVWDGYAKIAGIVNIDAIAQEVIDGKWGNGEDRKKRLTESGYDYNIIQSRVNTLLIQR